MTLTEAVFMPVSIKGIKKIKKRKSRPSSSAAGGGLASPAVLAPPPAHATALGAATRSRSGESELELPAADSSQARL